MQTKIVKAFGREINLTEEGLTLLVENKASLVIEFNTKSGMTLARKERTERNKLIEEVKRKSIDTENSIKVRRKEIIEEINKAYNCIVEPFETEELRLKQEKEKTENAERERINNIKTQINSIRSFSLNLFGKTSQELSDIIESVDLIDVEVNFSEFTQEAMQVKKETLTELNITLSGAIQKEKLAEEQAELSKKQEAFNKEQAEFAAWKKNQEKPVDVEVDNIDVETDIDETTAARMKIKSAMPPQFEKYIDYELAGDFAFELAKIL